MPRAGSAAALANLADAEGELLGVEVLGLQVVDDLVGRTLASASTMEADVRSTDGDKSARARKVGELVAERAKAAGIEDVVFDRGGNRYAGRVAAIADGAREGGLNL